MIALCRVRREERTRAYVASSTAEGKSNKEIAAVLSLSANTIAVHRANIMQTLGIHNTAELVVYAIREGLVSIP